MAKILMPRATAIWLLENTSLTFKQISVFCELHILEVNGIADGEITGKMPGINPITNKILTEQEIKKCEKNPKLKLTIEKTNLPKPRKISKGAKYTPLSKRHERPSSIIWILKKFPSITDSEICKLLRTTKNTVDSIKNKTHWNIENIISKDPTKLGLCSEKEILKIAEKYKNNEQEISEDKKEITPDESNLE
jgi:hypothetical protein